MANGTIKFVSNGEEKKKNKQKHLRDGGESKPLMKSLSEGINFISGQRKMQQIKQNYG